MRTLRFLSAGTLLLAAAGAAVEAVILLLTEGEVDLVRGPVFAVGALLALGTAYYLFRSRRYWESRIACPKCRERGVLSPSIWRRPRVSVLGTVVGGFIGSVIFAHARARGYTCQVCHALVALRTFGGWIALAWFVFLIVVIAVGAYLSDGA